MSLCDVRIPEQVIEVPKILSPSRHCRRRLRFAEQTAEQLVEVPMIISFSALQRTLEQHVDIPVLDGGGRRLHGFPQNRVQQRFPPSKSLTFQFRTATFQILFLCLKP